MTTPAAGKRGRGGKQRVDIEQLTRDIDGVSGAWADMGDVSREARAGILDAFAAAVSKLRNRRDELARRAG